MTKHILTFLFILPVFFAISQELPRSVKKVNPALFINNMDNERVYQQANIRENLVVFSRGFENRPIEEIQQSFHYLFLDEKEQSWLLEMQFDQHDTKISGKSFSTPAVNDFGFKIYEKKEDLWKEVTLEVVPYDFVNKLTAELIEIQQGSRGLYFYNQDPEKAVDMSFEKDKLLFKQNGNTVLTLLWKKEAFVWKK